MTEERGQALVEFALFLPILLLILTMLVETGFLLHAVAELDAQTRQTRELARQAAKGYDYYEEQTSVEDSLVFRDAHAIGMTEMCSIRITYVELVLENGVVRADSALTTVLGEGIPAPDVDVFAGEQQKIVDEFGEFDFKETTWVIVDTMRLYTPVIWLDVWPETRLRGRSVFRVTYHTFRVTE
jgi:hypothetical protein